MLKIFGTSSSRGIRKKKKNDAWTRRCQLGTMGHIYLTKILIFHQPKFPKKNKGTSRNLSCLLGGEVVWGGRTSIPTVPAHRPPKDLPQGGAVYKLMVFNRGHDMLPGINPKNVVKSKYFNNLEFHEINGISMDFPSSARFWGEVV